MRSWRDMPIGRKLTVVILLSAATAVLLSGTVAIFYEFVRYRQAIVRDTTTQADIIGEASAAALTFHDEKAAHETLAALRVRPEIVMARLYRSDGTVFAEYRRADMTDASAPANPPVRNPVFDSGQLQVCRPVSLAGDAVGTICMWTDLREQRNRVRSYAAIAGGVILVSLFLALFVAHRLHRVVTSPLLALAQLTRRVGEHGDFSVRAIKQSGDEIGILTDGFNQMLAQIQLGEESLRASEERFRQVTENIHEVFWMTSLEKDQMIYVSRAYEEIWGWPVGTLYAEPRAWLEAIHPEDRERVKAATPQQVTGRYDEEYRIVRPDGTMRWIRDRAFPVRDPDGKVYRIAGLAEDITERQRVAEALQMQARVLENMAEGVLVYDEHERISFTNSALDTMFGYAHGELIGRSTFVLNPYPPETCAKMAAEIRQRLKTQGSVERLFDNRRKDGSGFISESRIGRLQIGRQWYNVAVVQDVTEKQRLEKEILEISEREQARIGQDLHDGLCQQLYSIALSSSLLERELSEKSSPAASEAHRIANLLDDAITQARQLARGLYPVRLEAEGLQSALYELAANIRDRCQLNCDLECEDGVPNARGAAAIHLFRIAQEAVANAVKHSKARHIHIRLTGDAQYLIVRVSDDGVGFPATPARGMGLHIMEYRTRMIGGELSISPGLKGGTVVTCSIPQFGGAS